MKGWRGNSIGHRNAAMRIKARQRNLINFLRKMNKALPTTPLFSRK